MFKEAPRSTPAKMLSLPDWVPVPYRGRIQNEFVINGNHFWLSVTVSEDSTYISDVIIDNQNRVIYTIPYQNTQSLAVQGDNIWLGHPRGISRINRISRQRIDYELGPTYEKIIGWVKYKNNFYISTSDGKLFSLNPELGVINSLPFSRDSFDLLFISLESKKNSKKDQFSFTNPVLRGPFLSVGVIPTDRRHGILVGHSGVITFNLNDLENFAIVRSLGLDSSGMIKNPSIYFGINKLVIINGDIFILGNRTVSFEGGGFLEMGGIAVINKHRRRFDIPECGNKPVVAIKAHDKNLISILQKTVAENDYDFTYFECTFVLNEPNKNLTIINDFSNTTRTVRVLERVKLQKNDPKIKHYEFLKSELTSQKTQELIKDWNVIPTLKAYYNQPLNIKDYHSQMYYDIDGILYPEREQKFLDLN